MKCPNFNGPVLMRKGGMVGPGFQKWGPGGVCIHTSGSAFDVGGPLSTPLESIAFDAPDIIEMVFKACIEADVAVSPYGIEVEISGDGGQTWTPAAVSAVITEPVVTLTLTPGADLGDVARVTYTGPGLAYCDTGEPVQDSTVYVDAPAVLTLNCAGPVYPINAVAFSHLLRASGGWTPFVYSQAVPDLPTGLSLNGATGEISGTTTVVGITSHDFIVTDDESNTAPCTLEMEVVEPLEITLAVLPDAQVAGSYLESITYTGGKSPYVFSIVAGTLPSDFVLQEDGSIGSALVTSQPGDYDFTVGITDESGQLDEQAYTLTVEIALALNCADIHLNHAYVGVPYSQFAQANYGTLPYVFSLESGTLPGDLTLNASTGEVAGSDPATVSQNALTIRVTDDDLDYTECIPTLQVWEVLNITTTSLPDGVLDSAYSEQLAATGGDTPITWTLVSGTLPPGLLLSSSGLISGTCGSTEASYNFTARASSNDGQTDDQLLSIDVSEVAELVLIPLDGDLFPVDPQLDPAVEYTFSRSSTATVVDHEGQVLDCQVDEARFQGANRVFVHDGADHGAGVVGVQYVDYYYSPAERTTALTPSDAGATDYFGYSCALSADGSVLAVGAIYWDGPAGGNQGAVYVFDWNGSAWVERTTALTPSDAGGSDYFGRSCALSADGSVLAVGADTWDGAGGAKQGAVYVFDWNGSAWIERATVITTSDAEANDQFGISCALSTDGSVLAAGALNWDGPAGADQGAVYVFDWNGSAWVERTTALTASDAGASDAFGRSCALSADGSVLASGADAWDGPAGGNQGAVYVFDWSGSVWVERTTALTPSDAGSDDRLSVSCALSADGSVLAVGANLWDGAAGGAQGTAYIFDWNGSAWVERPTALIPSDAKANDQFGISCALSTDGSVLAVGANLWDGAAGADQGAVYVFDDVSLSHTISDGILYLDEAAATNLFLNSDAPVTQTITTPAGNHVCWMTGTGSITLSGGLSGVVTAGSPVTGDPAGVNVVCTLADEVLTAQFATGVAPTSYIPTAGAAVTRDADALSYSNVPTPNETRIVVDDANSDTDDWDGVVDEEGLLANIAVYGPGGRP